MEKGDDIYIIAGINFDAELVEFACTFWGYTNEHLCKLSAKAADTHLFIENQILLHHRR